MSKNPSRDLSVFQPVEGELEHGSFDASVDVGVQPALRGNAARRAWEEHELDLLRGRLAEESHWDQVEASMELTLALTTGPASLQQMVKRAMLLRGRVGNQGTPALRRPRPDRPVSPQVRRFYLALGSPKTSCPISWMACRRGESCASPLPLPLACEERRGATDHSHPTTSPSTQEANLSMGRHKLCCPAGTRW